MLGKGAVSNPTRLVLWPPCRGNLGLGSYCHGHEDRSRFKKDIFGRLGGQTTTGPPPVRVGCRFPPI